MSRRRNTHWNLCRILQHATQAKAGLTETWPEANRQLLSQRCLICINEYWSLQPTCLTEPDYNIPDVFSKICIEVLSPMLSFIIQQTLDIMTVPDDWKGTLVTLVFKKGVLPWCRCHKSCWPWCGHYGRVAADQKHSDPHVSLLWSIARQMKMAHYLLRTVGERCLVVQTDKSFLNFYQATQHLSAMALCPPGHSLSPR